MPVSSVCPGGHRMIGGFASGLENLAAPSAEAMNGPSTSEIIFLSVNHSITLMGKVWLIVMVLRVLILLLAAYPLYQDEQERFICNTIQPGCANACYDLFAPVSLPRFWLLQLAGLCLPYATFVCYVVHRVSSDLHGDAHHDDDNPSGSTPNAEEGGQRRCRQRGGGRFAAAYVIHLLLRILLEAGFGAAQHLQFGLAAPRRFLCHRAPCTVQVDCYVSRPSEKTLMLHVMQAAAALSLLLSALDLACSAHRCWSSTRRRRRRRRREGWMGGGGARRRRITVRAMCDEEERCFLAADAGAGPGGPAADGRVPPGLQDVGEDAIDRAGTFRVRTGSMGSSGGGVGVLATAQLPLPSDEPNGNPPSEPLGAGGSEGALCPPEPAGTPRSFHVSKRGRLKPPPPPPPPRRDLALSLAGAVRDVSAATVCTRRVGQYTLVELTGGAELADNTEVQEKRSEWV